MAAETSSPFSKDPLAAFAPDEVDGDRSQSRLKSHSVATARSPPACGQGHGAVHGAGIEMNIAESLGQKPAQSALPGPGGPVYGDDEFTIQSKNLSLVIRPETQNLKPKTDFNL